jgi:hypothetical protein
MYYSENAVFTASGPLQITFPISSYLTVVTSVFGDARQFATVSIQNGSVTMWSAQLSQALPNQATPYPISVGGLTIEKGAGFYLTIPTTMQQGSVVLSAMISSGSTPPTQFTAQVAQWSLTSAASAPGAAASAKSSAKKAPAKKKSK